MSEDSDLTQRKLMLLKAFREGMIKRHYGMFIDSEAVNEEGMLQADAAATELRALPPDGIRALEPLLDDPDTGVRSGAADFLAQEMPEKALPILRELAQALELESGATARLALRTYKADKALH